MGPNVLLINPGVNAESQNKFINQIINKTFPTSLGVLAGCLEAWGAGQAEILDEQLMPLDEDLLRAKIAALQPPRLVGLSVLTMNFKRARQVASMVRRVAPDSLLVFGGIHPTVLPEESLVRGGADVVVRGEGEHTLVELVQAALTGQDLSTIQGISLRASTGQIVHTPDRPLIQDLDEIPPFPYHLFEKHKEAYGTFGGVFTSRGCPHRCIFCSSRSISGKRYRFFSLERVLSEMTLLVEKYGQDSIWLMDDNIAVNRPRFMALCEAIKARGLHTKACFHGSMRGDNATPEILDAAKAANFQMIAYGLETGSERLMKLIDKGETVAEVAEAVKMTARHGLAAATTIIFGLPSETREDRRQGVRLVTELPLSSVRFNTLVPYPGTPAFAQLQPQGKILVKDDWANFGVQYMWEGDDIPYVPEGTGRFELMFETMFANLTYYLSPRGLLRMFKSSFAGGNVVKLSHNWFLSPQTMWRLSRVGLLLCGRFLVVTCRMLGEKLSRGGRA